MDKFIKGDGGHSKRFKLTEIRDFLYMRIIDNDYTDELYGFYIAICSHGKRAIYEDRDTYKKVIVMMMKEYGGE